MSPAVANTLVLCATGAVFVVLCAGLVNMLRSGSQDTSQRLMRWRVGLQFLAILVVIIAMYFKG